MIIRNVIELCFVVAERNACLLIYNQKTNWSIYEPFKNFGDRDVITAGILHGKFLILGFKTGTQY